MMMIAAGAIMRFAVTVKGHGFNVHTTGVILIVGGIVGAILSIVYWASSGGLGRKVISRRTTAVSTQTPARTVIGTTQPVVHGEGSVVDQREVQ